MVWLTLSVPPSKAKPPYEPPSTGYALVGDDVHLSFLFHFLIGAFPARFPALLKQRPV